jgi:hypothetical protein
VAPWWVLFPWDLSTRSRRRRRPGHCFGGLIRSLPDSLPRVVARVIGLPRSAFFRPDAEYDATYRKELGRNPRRRRGIHVCGVDTHAATHSLALVTAATGAIVDQAAFPNTPPGLDRALNWITHRIGRQSALVVIEGVGSYGAGFAQRVNDAGLLVAEPSAMPAAQRRGVGKTDLLTELLAGSCGGCVLCRAGLARFAACDRRWGCASGFVGAGGAAAGLSGGDGRSVSTVSAR